MPFLMVVVSPTTMLVSTVSVASPGFLALLDAIGARAGGAKFLRATARVTLGSLGNGTDRWHRRYRWDSSLILNGEAAIHLFPTITS
jgi:hypothetical protein